MPQNEREHIHKYVLEREVKERGMSYRFYTCYERGCPEPWAMRISEAREQDGTAGKGDGE